MSFSSTSVERPASAAAPAARLAYLDAARAFALLLGVIFHGALSFSPLYLGWAVQDVSTCSWVPSFLLVSHSFRMGLFFFLAGYFSQLRVARLGTVPFLRVRLVQLGIPLVAGWFLLRPLLVSGWVMGAASLRGEVSIAAGLREGFASLKSLPQGFLTGTHLWFLYYLVLVTVVALALRVVCKIAVSAAPLSRATAVGHEVGSCALAWFSRSRWALPVLAVPTALALGGMDGWGMDTPDRSLWPHGAVLAVYGFFFLVGLGFAREEKALDAFLTLTPWRVFCAAASVSLILVLAPFQGQPGSPHFVAIHHAFNASYALAMWSLTAVTLGLFKTFLSRPRAPLRFLAESSYWVYLLHLPLIVWLQIAVAEVPLPGAVKLVAIVVATVTLALVSYRWAVRDTWVGAVLRGGRAVRSTS